MPISLTLVLSIEATASKALKRVCDFFVYVRASNASYHSARSLHARGDYRGFFQLLSTVSQEVNLSRTRASHLHHPHCSLVFLLRKFVHDMRQKAMRRIFKAYVIEFEARWLAAPDSTHCFVLTQAPTTLLLPGQVSTECIGWIFARHAALFFHK